MKISLKADIESASDGQIPQHRNPNDGYAGNCSGSDETKKILQAQDKLAAGPNYKDFGLVSQTKRGLPINPYYFETRWLDTLKKSGLPKIRFHDLRHTHASLLLKQNVHSKIVSERPGHSYGGITLDCYSHTYRIDYTAAEEIDKVLKA